MHSERNRILKELASRLVCKYYPEYANRVDRIWESLHRQADLSVPGHSSDTFGNVGQALAMHRGSSAKIQPALLGIAIFALCEDDKDKNKKIAPIKNIPIGLRAKLQDVLSEYLQSAGSLIEVEKDTDISTVDNLGKLLDEKLTPLIDSLDKSKTAVLEKIDKAKHEVVSHMEAPVCDSLIEFEIAGDNLDCAFLKWKDRKAPIRLRRKYVIFLCVLALHAKHTKADAKGVSERDIFNAISEWKDKNERYVSGVARDLRVLLDHKNISNLYNAEQWSGYKLNSAPCCIKISGEIFEAMKSIVAKDSHIGKAIFNS